MELPDGFRRVLAGILFLATSLSLLFGVATWLMGTPWDTPTERLAPFVFLLVALLLTKVYTWIIRQPDLDSASRGNSSRMKYGLVLGYAMLATVVVWVVTFTSRWFFPSLRRTSIVFVLFVASIVVLPIHHFILGRDRSS